MEYTQERVATLHDFGDADPAFAPQRAALVVPMTDRDAGSLTADRLFSSLEDLGLASVIAPIRAPETRVPSIVEWVESFAVDIQPIWCNGPALETLLADHGLDGVAGKGRDVWVGMGLTGGMDHVVFHDADVKSYEPRDIRKLLSPLEGDAAFTKAYYARIEDGNLYGRLFRLLYEPLIATLERARPAPILDYLGAFRYALAGEFAMTTDVAHSMRVPRRWGLEVGTLGEAYRTVGFEGTAQVDLGRYEHGHRAVSGPEGLSTMAEGVAETMFRVLEDQGVEPAYGELVASFERAGLQFVRQYSADARFNDFQYDEEAERKQVEAYAQAIAPPGPDDRLPAWSTTDLDPTTLLEVVRSDLNRAQ
ncbi:Glycosyltransferase [Halanaeroarchaeum sp. HSR-CO]|uniref:glycosyl transferase family 2 n=1 Tax=Halanaeroarchaeum sp. HSR-CO TaxID=2866382 RepID=UPI00217D6122|nr:glycosyl transferase family 2 [Halanaeroarchaeum sp. HSR-CO]UWG47234.1 Glycosyltransferase [Halanaeroarchaeum sp. HSR-CO]